LERTAVGGQRRDRDEDERLRRCHREPPDAEERALLGVERRRGLFVEDPSQRRLTVGRRTLDRVEDERKLGQDDLEGEFQARGSPVDGPEDLVMVHQLLGALPENGRLGAAVYPEHALDAVRGLPLRDEGPDAALLRREAVALRLGHTAPSSDCSNISPIATTILRAPAYGLRECATSMLSTIRTSPGCHGNSTAFSR